MCGSSSGSSSCHITHNSVPQELASRMIISNIRLDLLIPRYPKMHQILALALVVHLALVHPLPTSSGPSNAHAALLEAPLPRPLRLPRLPLEATRSVMWRPRAVALQQAFCRYIVRIC